MTKTNKESSESDQEIEQKSTLDNDPQKNISKSDKNILKMHKKHKNNNLLLTDMLRETDGLKIDKKNLCENIEEIDDKKSFANKILIPNGYEPQEDDSTKTANITSNEIENIFATENSSVVEQINEFKNLENNFNKFLYPIFLLQTNHQKIKISHKTSDQLFDMSYFDFEKENLPLNDYVLICENQKFNLTLDECKNLKKYFEFYKAYNETNNQIYYDYSRNKIQKEILMSKGELDEDEKLYLDILKIFEDEQMSLAKNKPCLNDTLENISDISYKNEALYKEAKEDSNFKNYFCTEEPKKIKTCIVLDTDSEIEKSSSMENDDNIEENIKHLLNEKTSNLRHLIEINRYFYKKQVVQKMFNYKIYKKDLATLKTGCWINDKIINLYFRLLIQNSKENSKENSNENNKEIHKENNKENNKENSKENSKENNKIYVFTTYFFLQINKKGFEGVKKWTEKINIFDYKKLIIPVHIPGHWIFILVDTLGRAITPYDPLGVLRYSEAYKIKKWLECESIYRFNKEINFKINTPYKHPLQQNGNDCGIFVIYYGKRIFENKIISAENKIINTKLLRYRIMHEIGAGKIFYNTDDL
ncbi:SUMO1 sentrin specific peptidase 1 [Gurleya vavrai]